VTLLKYARRRSAEMICPLDGLPFRDLRSDYNAFTVARRTLERIAERYPEVPPPPMSTDPPPPRTVPPLTPPNCGPHFRRRY
jgi:hypothetical protein